MILFTKGDLACSEYVDDTILAGPTLAKIDKEIQGLEVSTGNQDHFFNCGMRYK